MVINGNSNEGRFIGGSADQDFLGAFLGPTFNIKFKTSDAVLLSTGDF